MGLMLLVLCYLYDALFFSEVHSLLISVGLGVGLSILVNGYCCTYNVGIFDKDSYAVHCDAIKLCLAIGCD